MKGFGWSRSATRRMSPATVVTLVALIMVIGAGPAQAQTFDPYQTDPLGLIALRDETNNYSEGTDSWTVWVCDVPDGSVPVTAAQAAGVLSGEVNTYFRSLSNGIYSPTFSVGGTVVASAPSQWPDNPFRTQSECENLVGARAGNASEGVVIVIDAGYTGGYGTGGIACFAGQTCPVLFPANHRLVVLGASTVVGQGGEGPALRTAAHELGHALFWPHSFGGLVAFDDVDYEYDNPMDVMSGGDGIALDLGTPAINRYAAGWLGSDSVIFHRGGKLVYQISATSGLQMLILPTEQRGVYEAIGVRVRSGYDAGLPTEGVEVYRVDQGAGACGSPVGGSCFGPDRRTNQVPAVADLAALNHVHGVGDSFVVRGLTLTVLTRAPTSFTIEVSGKAVSERFHDDNDNLHEANIEAIADRGITRGCNPPLVDRFCPSANVTRAEMAAFLVTALGESPASAFAARFPDVPAGSWFTPYVERLAQLGITAGNADGTYGPDRAVTRAEMAVFLARAFALAESSPGTTFADVDQAQWYAQAVEAIRLAGITAGCATGPPRFCPVDPVKRDQMATFLARALHIGG